MTPASPCNNRLMIVGALHVDDIAKSQQALIPRASNPVHRQQRVGGVAANASLAAASTELIGCEGAGQRIALAAATGTDAAAGQLKNTLLQAGIEPCLQAIPGCMSGRYIAELDPDGELYIGLSDVALAEALDTAAIPLFMDDDPCQALLMDANLSEQALVSLSDRASKVGITQAAMSVSPAKSLRLLSIAASLDLLFCNRREAIALAASDFPIDANLDLLADALLARGFRQFVLTDAAAPVIVQSNGARQYVPVPPVIASSTVNGAGDALAGATFAAWCAGQQLGEAVCRTGLPQAASVLMGRYMAPELTA